MDAEIETGQARLPLRAQELLKLLIGLRGKNPFCWPSEDRLAEELGVSTRTIRFWVAFLADAGLIEFAKASKEVWRTLFTDKAVPRGNLYWIPPRPGHERQKSASHTGRNLPLTQAEIGRSNRQKSDAHPAAPLCLLSSAAASASAAAAADQSADGENAIKALEEMDMPAMVKPIAEKSPSLAAAVLLHCRWRFSQGNLTPVGNKPGYIVSVLRNPEAAGFMQDDDLKWHPPPGQPRVKSRDAPEHPKVQAWLDGMRGFDDLPDDERKKIEDFVRKRAPLFANASSGNAGFRSECIGVFIQWRKEGKL